MYKLMLEEQLHQVVKDLGYKVGDIFLSIPENNEFGDYSTNVALQLSKLDAGSGYHSALGIANQILEKLGHPAYLQRVEIAGPGFINFYLKEQSLIKSLMDRTDQVYKPDKKRNILIEYGQPNTHKPLHIGHLRTLFIGETISRLLQYQGSVIFRVSYGSDIGPTVAKALWGIEHLKEQFEQAKTADLRKKAEFLGEAYAFGHKNYEDSPEAKAEIDSLTKKLYQRDSSVVPLWEETKKWSLGYFDSIFSRLGTEFDHILVESAIESEGKQIVLDNVGKVFVKDDGAIIFPGEKYGLHNRVFITSAGNPTYEGKEMGLTAKEQELFPYDKSIHVVDKRQAGFFEVVTKALEMIDPTFKGKKMHLGYGYITLSTGAMSSRKGNIVTADQFVDNIKQELANNFPKSESLDDVTLEKIALAAIKFYYLKYSLNNDITFEVDKAISIQGDTGVYLLYTYTRSMSLIKKSALKDIKDVGQKDLSDAEREVLRQLEYFPWMVHQSSLEYQPNLLATYLLNLAKSFNNFYQYHPILGSQEEKFRIKLVQRVAETIKLGLYLLGIETVEQM